MGLEPFVSLVSTTGKMGKPVEVLGQGFTGTTAVSFDGTAVASTVKSDTRLAAIAPTGAATGFVT
ncbi:MAG: IPT/TIG domain-containing protein [Terriglobales bacterium]